MKRKGQRRRGVHLFAGIAPNGRTTLTLCGKYGREDKHHLKTARFHKNVTCRACAAELKQRLR